MATTPTYSWPIPDDTDIVKDGADAIRDLGNAIDTTVDGLPGAGLVHINTTTFSAVASQNVESVFNSTYDHYKIFWTITASTASELSFRFLTAAVALATDYSSRQSTLGATYGTATSTTLFQIGVTRASSTYNSGEINVFNPFLAEKKAMTSIMTDFANPSEARIAAGHNSLQTSRDGFQIYPASGTITGKIYTFGVKK